MAKAGKSSDSRLADIVNRTGALSRLTTERRNHLKEFAEAKRQLQHLKESKAGSERISKQEKVVNDCTFMLKYSQTQFQKEFRELENLLQQEDELIETAEYVKAMAVLMEAKKALNDD